MKRKVNIMPMAGDGKRFKDSGYKIIKPLIKKKKLKYLYIQQNLYLKQTFGYSLLEKNIT